MGIIILPFILLAILCFAYAVFEIFKKRGILKSISFLGGLGISFCLLIVTIFLLIFDGKMYVFAPYFLLPFISILMPFILYIMKFVKNPYWLDSLLVSIIFSGIAIFSIFYNLTSILEYFKILTFH
jgi:hypothetical protein